MFSTSDTIVAMATPAGRGGIGVVRLSGATAHEVARAILTTKGPLVPRHATSTHVRTAPPAKDGRQRPGIEHLVDQAVATYFQRPASYTGEDVVEISAHGSPIVLRQIVNAALLAGARLAEPGEFTLRAFLNGRVDLVQAEAVADLIEAVTPLQARAAFDQLEGTLTREIGEIDVALFEVVARLEASLDFPEEGFHFVAPGSAGADVAAIEARVARLIGDAGRGRLIREGAQVAIAGKPNVGKSSLFNSLVGASRAIVTPTPGTTRDFITEMTDICGLRITLIDTAGERAAPHGTDEFDEVERAGVERARGARAVADLVLVVLDRSRRLEEVDRLILQETSSTPRVIVINKIDVPEAWCAAAIHEMSRSGSPAPADQFTLRPLDEPRADQSTVEGRQVQGERSRPVRGRPVESPTRRQETGAGQRVVAVSVRTGEGLPALRAAIAGELGAGGDAARDTPAVTNLRHLSLLERARTALRSAHDAIEGSQGMLSEEFVLADLQDARNAFEEITGTRTTDDLLAHIFGRFCIGK